MSTKLDVVHGSVETRASNANAELDFVRSDLAAAEKAGCTRLVPFLTARIAKLEELGALIANKTPIVDAAYRAWQEAKTEAEQCGLRKMTGSLDREEFRAMCEDLEYAINVAEIRGREHERVFRLSLGPTPNNLFADEMGEHRGARGRAEASTNDLVRWCFEETQPLSNDRRNRVGGSAEERAWEPFFEPQALAAYEKKVAQRATTAPELRRLSREPLPVEELQKLFEHRAKLRDERDAA